MKAIVGGHVLTITHGNFAQGVVLVDDGRFVAAGAELAVPPGAEVIDARGKYVAPGLVDAHTHIGLRAFSETTSPVTPQMRILDAIELDSPGFKDALTGGVTSVIITPGSANVICGASLAMKTGGRDLPSRILRDPAGLKMAWRKGTGRPSHDVPYPVSLMGIAGIVRTTFTAALNYREQRRLDQLPFDPGLELVVQVLERQLPARIHSFTPVEIQAILRLQDEFGFDFTVEHGFEAHFIADELAARGIPVVYGPGPGLRRHKMFPHRGPHVPAQLHRAGVKVALQTDHPDRSIKQLRLFGAVLMRYTDLTADEVMTMLTLNGAEIAGIADRVGSITPGKDADFVLYSGHPLHIQSRVEAVYVDGEPVLIDGEVIASPYGPVSAAPAP